MMSYTKHEMISGRLGLAPDVKGLLRCQGQIVGDHPIYLPTNSAFTKLVVQDAHLRTLHGGDGLTMAKVREKWWVEKLRSLVKAEIHGINQCKCYRIKPPAAPPTSALHTFRTQGERAF